MKKTMLFVLLLLYTASGCAPDAEEASQAISVEVARQGDGYLLLRGGEPYTINGAGIEFGDAASFATHGGTSFRTWTTDNAAETAAICSGVASPIVSATHIAMSPSASTVLPK